MPASLHTFDISSNQISKLEALPDSLHTFDISDNQVTDLKPLQFLIEKGSPVKWESWIKNAICVEGNPFENPPPEIVKQGNEAILNYFAQQEAETAKDYLFEAKLLIIGEAGAGKTTFAKRIKKPTAKMPTKAESTHGIAISDWSFSLKKDAFPDINHTKTDFFVNLWDFGGQEIYHATHQFFFAEKSLYVLLADTREQKTDFSHWLNTVEQLCGEDSILFILLNKREGHDWAIDEQGYRQRFDSIMREVHTIDLSDSEAVLPLQQRIKHWLTKLDGIGQSLIKSWVDIRKALAKEKKQTISLERFQAICAEHGQTKEENVYYISKYFHRIGVFTHYVDDPILKHRVYLDSNALVKTVYDLLEHVTVKAKEGRLSAKEIETVWAHKKLESDTLLALLDKFGLMYQATSNLYIIPEHLPKVMPYAQWQHEGTGDALHFRYTFDKYMPKGLMSRLIVALHDYIPDHALVWHRGVNLSLKNKTAHAEIIEQYGGTNQFDIRIVGAFQRDLLVVIREAFDKILGDFKKLDVVKAVQCPCAECGINDAPYFHNIKVLEKAVKAKVPSLQCQKSFESIPMERLCGMIYSHDSLKKQMHERFDGLEGQLNAHDRRVDRKLTNLANRLTKNHNRIFNKIEQLPNKLELQSAIDASNYYQYQAIEKYLNVAFDVIDKEQMEGIEEMKAFFKEIQNAPKSKWESKVKFSIPLLSLLGIGIETKFDLKAFLEDIDKKTTELAAKYRL